MCCWLPVLTPPAAACAAPVRRDFVGVPLYRIGALRDRPLRQGLSHSGKGLCSGDGAGRGAAWADRLLHCGLSGAGLPPVFSSPDREVDVGLVAAEDGVEQGGKGAAGRVVGPPGECAAGVDAVREDGRLLRVAAAERRRALNARRAASRPGAPRRPPNRASTCSTTATGPGPPPPPSWASRRAPCVIDQAYLQNACIAAKMET